MADIEFSYKGKRIVIRETHPDAVVSVDGREFTCHHHHGEKGSLAMWMCDEAYFASPDIRELARHFADYGYMFDDPGRVVVDDTGAVVDRTKKSEITHQPKTGHKPKPDKEAEQHAGHGDDHGGGH